MTAQQWANIGDDEGALHALLLRVRDHVPVALIDYLWIFPPRRIAAGESIVFVVAAFDDDPVRRRVITARFTVSRNRKGQASVTARFDEHGSAPGHAVGRILDGVLHRLGEDADTSLREQQIGGDIERWNALVVELGGSLHATASPHDAPPPAADPADAPDATTGSDVRDEAGAHADADRPPDDTPDFSPPGRPAPSQTHSA